MMIQAPTNTAPKPLYFEERRLIGAEPPHMLIVEREFDDGTIEWWGLGNVQFSDGQRAGQAQVPFKIDVPELPELLEWTESTLHIARAQAFANLAKSWQEKSEGAKAQVAQQLAGQSKIIKATEGMAQHIAKGRLQ
jgi:hypothetical protein